MGADNFVATSVGGKRAARRARVLLAARLKTPFGEVDCRLRDLSRKGALVECATQPPVGSEVTFVRGSTIVPARVAWTAGGRIGLEFHYMIDEHELLVQLRKNTGGQGGDRFRRPGLGEELSEKDRKLAEQVEMITVSMDLPFAQQRFAKEAKIGNVKFYSDYKTANFGTNNGLLIEPLHLLARAVIVVDKQNVVRYMQVVPELTELPDLSAAMNVAKSLL